MTFDEFTSAVFEEALRMGCTAAEVYFVEGDSAEIGVLEGELDQYSVSHNFGLNLRVEYDGRSWRSGSQRRGDTWSRAPWGRCAGSSGR